MALGASAGAASAVKPPPPTGPAASYTFAPAKPLVGVPVAFTSTATAGSSPIFWQSWDFGDRGHADAIGSTATHTYSAPGIYTVTLSVLAWDGRSDTETKQIEVFQPPTAGFTFAPAKPGAGRPVTLTSTSTAAPGLTLPTLKWDLNGDGQYGDATGASATRTFSDPGTYTVGLQVTDSKGITSTTTQQIAVYAPPVAAFGFTPAAPVPNQPMTFTSSSSDSDGTIVSQRWDVNGDGFNDGTGATLTKSFAAGHYTVSLQVTDSQGLVTTTSRSFDVVPPPTAAFDTQPAQPGAGLPATFTSSSAAAPGYTLDSQKWDLDGDGQYDDATGATATRTFATPGHYTVGLEVTDSRGITSTLRKTVAVFAPPSAAFDFTPATPLAGDEVTFNSTSADSDGTIADATWDLNGDGQFGDATGNTVTHTFTEGRHTVALRVTDSQGLTDTIEHDVVVAARPVVPAPSAPVSFDTTTALPPAPQVGIFNWLSPFPVVRIAGVARRTSTKIRVFSVLTPLGATVDVHCSGRRCPHRPMQTQSIGAQPATLLRLHEFERTLPKGTRLTVSVTRVGFVGKYTRFQLRPRKAPKRTDLCYVPGNDQPTRCPSKP